MSHFEEQAALMKAGPPDSLTNALSLPPTALASGNYTPNLTPNLTLPPVVPDNLGHSTRIEKYVPLPDGSVARVDNSKSYPCAYPDCHRVFSTSSHRNEHYRIHTKERPYTCTVENCNKRFAHTSAFNVHKRIHSGERPYKCEEELCTKSFTKSYDLQRHMRVHTKEKPYLCPFDNCGRTFAQNSHLIKHRSVHGKELLDVNQPPPVRQPRKVAAITTPAPAPAPISIPGPPPLGHTLLSDTITSTVTLPSVPDPIITSANSLPQIDSGTLQLGTAEPLILHSHAQIAKTSAKLAKLLEESEKELDGQGRSARTSRTRGSGTGTIIAVTAPAVARTEPATEESEDGGAASRVTRQTKRKPDDTTTAVDRKTGKKRREEASAAEGLLALTKDKN